MAADSGGPTRRETPDARLPANDPATDRPETGAVTHPETRPETGEIERTVFSGSDKPVATEKAPEKKAAAKTATPTTATPTTAKPTGPKPTVPSTRASTAWITWCVTALVLVGLIVFILQNTSKTDVSFLWMDGSAPLGVMLLIAAVGAALITALLGTIRITQLRRLSQRRTKPSR